MELYIPKRGEPDPQLACTTKRLNDTNDIPLRKASENPILDMHMYEVEYVDGKKSALSANLIAENIFTKIYE